MYIIMSIKYKNTYMAEDLDRCRDQEMDIPVLDKDSWIRHLLDIYIPHTQYSIETKYLRKNRKGYI